MITDATNNYGQRSINVTVLPLELRRDREANKKAMEASVASSEEYKRVPKGKKVIVNPLPPETEYATNGDEIIHKVKTKTTRTDK